jgi:xanthine dehydrogenase iron-sulfur cluster and FAD-binding subunit A
MAAKALLDQVPNPTTDQVKEWMSANLCRCTGYYKILESVMAVVEGKVEAEKSDEAGRQARIQSLYQSDTYKSDASD